MELDGNYMKNIKDILVSDIKKFNIYLLLVLGFLFISLVGAASYAIFTIEDVGNNNISITVG